MLVPGSGTTPVSHRVEKDLRRAVVEGERALHEGGARENDEADAVALEPLDERGGDVARALHARRGDVRRIHAEGGVENEEDVDAARHNLIRPLSPLRPSDREDQKEHADEEKGGLPSIATAAHAERQPLEERGLGESLRHPSSPSSGPHEEENERGEKQQPIESLRSGELHQGNLRRRVRESASSSTRNRSAAVMKRGASSV